MNRSQRPLFVATILTGSFLLFLIQPMVARMALPLLGGAPNVWNSAMLVYQALLLAGYAYAHALARLAVRRQATVHLAMLLLAALTLPIAIADLPPPAPGSEAWWVPLLFLASVGPVFVVVAAQAPLMQRWYASDAAAADPWALYAASNLGSFAGLLAYPLLAEPLLALHAQSIAWSLGFGLLVVLVALAARARWHALPPAETARDGGERVGWRRIALWLALAAVPSGLMLSTTTHLTTDIFAMPLLWVIPLGFYLLSFVVAFADRRTVANGITLAAPLVMLLAGGLAMGANHSGTLGAVFASIALLFVVAVSLHARLYDSRPAPAQLTLFYLVMAAGGAIGGAFTALVAPLWFDWVWEHPLLVLAAAALLPLPARFDWRRLPGLEPGMARIGAMVLLAVAGLLAWQLREVPPASLPGAGMLKLALVLGLAATGMMLAPWRLLWLGVLAALMVVQGGEQNLRDTWAGVRSRSYFGIYTVRDYSDQQLRTLAHGTTLHGQQSLAPGHERDTLTYYGPGSGAALALRAAPTLYGAGARIGVIGLGTGTLACHTRPGEKVTIFEIDPLVARLSQDGTFTFVRQCAPAARIVIGDARLELARQPRGSFDVLAVDAFSSDAIPLHLITDEAFGVYLDALSPRGILLVHISNRFIELEPVIAAAARRRGLHALVRNDNPYDRTLYTPSSWIALSRDPHVLNGVVVSQIDSEWDQLEPPAARAWTDDHASVLPAIRWANLLRKP